jgi:hypothetical protein
MGGMNNNNDCVSKMCTLECERGGGGGEDTNEAYPAQVIRVGVGGKSANDIGCCFSIQE